MMELNLYPSYEFIMLDTRFDNWEYLDGDNRIYYRYSKSRAENYYLSVTINVN